MTAAPSVLFVPLRIEQAALGGSAKWVTLRSGMGRDRARVAAARGLAIEDAPAVAVAGLCAAAAPGLEPGDIVLASRLECPGEVVVEVGANGLLAAELRRHGFRVHVGPIVSVERIAGAAERRALGARGVLAVDMESAWLAAAAAGRPLAVVRVVVETAERELWHPATAAAGVRALATLRRMRPVLDEWAQAVGPRRVVAAAPRSFCAGVERAIEIVERALEQRGAPVYVRKQIVHNHHVVADLEQRGAVFVEELDQVPAGATVVFSAHGVSPAVKHDARGRSLDVIDATCPLVNKVHAEARRFAAEGHSIFLVGHAGHEEVEGTFGEAPGSIVIVQNIEDAARVEVPNPENVSYLTQTTLAVDETAEILEVLRCRFPTLRGPRSDDICYATTNRQDAVRAVAAETDLILVVGSRTSSNSRRLVEVARRQGIPAHLVDDERDVALAWLSGVTSIGVTAGASAPEALVTRIVAALADLGPVQLSERATASESITFRLPREVATA